MEAVAKIVAYLIIGAFYISITIVAALLFAFFVSEIKRIFKKRPNAPPPALDDECPYEDLYI